MVELVADLKSFWFMYWTRGLDSNETLIVVALLPKRITLQVFIFDCRHHFARLTFPFDA